VPPVTHTHALFAEQSQSILDNLIEIIGRLCAVVAGDLGQASDWVLVRAYRRANEEHACSGRTRDRGIRSRTGRLIMLTKQQLYHQMVSFIGIAEAVFRAEVKAS
jgi:hypothetical protein